MPGMRPSAPPRCGVSRPTTTAHRMQVGSSANGADPTFITRSAQQSRNRMNALTRSDLFTLEAYASERAAFRAREIGRASCRERVWQYESISVVAGILKKKKQL